MTREGLAGRWLAALERMLPAEAQREGLEYARSGQIVSMEAQRGVLSAVVQGRAHRPYATRIVVPRYSDAEWDGITAAMASEAVYLVKLLAGEWPAGMDAVVADVGRTVLPEPAEPVRIECSCAEPAPCKHAAAAAYIFAEQLAEDPQLVLTLRGLPADALLERLRHARTINARGVMAAHADPMIPASQMEPPPLDECMHDYWRAGHELSQLQAAPPAQHASHALLRRLGPSPLKGRFPLAGLLASVYDEVARFAVKLRDQAERIE